MPPERIYLDHNATTPVRPEVVEAMLPFLRGGYGNPNSVHSAGQEARRAVETAREAVASLIHAGSADEIMFTSGGSEADAAAVAGGAERVRRESGGRKDRILISAVEHEAVTGCCELLEARGFKTDVAGVDADGSVDPRKAAARIRDETALVSVMLANNEVGTLQPVGEIAKACRARGVLFHVDAVQAAGKVPVDVRAIGADLLALSGHKLNAPKGVGALFIRKGTVLDPLIAGHQEDRRRGGTENTASIVGFGRAAELAADGLESRSAALTSLRDRIEEGALLLPGARRTVPPGTMRLPNTAHLCFEGLEGHHLVMALDLEGICVSGGAACKGGLTGLSGVLKAMGVPEETGKGALRVSVGWGSSDADVERFLSVLSGCVSRLRGE